MALTAPSAVLTGSTIASSFDQLLFVDAAAGMTEATLKIVSTEVGKSALSISDEHVLIKGVDTNNAAGFEVQQTDGTSILKVAAGTPSVLVSGSGVKLYVNDAGGEYISGDGTDLTITSGNDIVLTATSVGIGQSTPASPNSVAKFLHIGSSGDAHSSIVMEDNANTWELMSNDGFSIFDGTSEYLTILNTGNVGIGDSDPSEAKLSITGVAASDYGLKIDQDQNVSALYIDSESTSATVLDIDAGPTTTGSCLTVTAGSLSSGSAAIFNSGSTDLETTASGGFVELNHTANSASKVSNLLFIKNDHADSTGTTALKIQQDSTGPAISATGGIVEEGGVLKENLLTNSGFDVWSNSTLENVGSSFISGDNTDMDTQGDWVASSGDTTLSISSGELKVLNTKGSASHIVGAYLDVLDPNNVVTGKLYRINFDITSDGSMTENIKFSLAGTKMGDVPITAGKVSHSIVFEADTDAVYVTFIVNSSIDNAEFFLLDNVTLYEVTPGCVAADALACDGWVKSSTVDLFRQHSDSTYTKDGSFYSAKMTKGTNSLETVFTPLSAINDNSEYYKRYAGRTVTFGAWIYSLTASDNVKVSMYDDVTGYTLFSTYAGANAWEWQEVTLTVPSNITTFKPAIYLDGDSADVAYISQPMLVFGSSIGEGNYTRPHGEVIYFENQVTSNLLNNITSSSVAATALNVEADSNGVIPKGAKAINVFGRVRDSGSAGSDYISIYLKNDDTGDSIARFEVSGIANDRYRDTIQWQDCDADGDVHYVIDASGSDTLDTSMFNYCAVQLR